MSAGPHRVTCPLPCLRCSQFRRLRDDELCIPCGEGQDAARLKDWHQDRQRWARRSMARAS